MSCAAEKCSTMKFIFFPIFLILTQKLKDFLIKFVFILCFLLFFLQGYAQKPQRDIPNYFNSVLIAQNTKHTREYFNGDPLKIYYHNNGEIIKVKGWLLICDDKKNRIILFRKRDTMIIEADSISSVARWRRNGKIATAIIAGTGALAIGLALAMPANHSLNARGANFIGFMLVLYSIIDLWYVAIATPAIYLSEIISKRSDKRGYRFFVQEVE